MRGVADWPLPGHEGESEEYGNFIVTCEVIKERVKQLKAALREKVSFHLP
jgi:hypothetical protein